MSERSTVKTPPSFGDIDGKDYTTWKNEVELWHRITDVELKKQAPAIVLALAGKAREIGLQMDVTKLNVDDGVDKLLQKLDNSFKREFVHSGVRTFIQQGKKSQNVATR